MTGMEMQLLKGRKSDTILEIYNVPAATVKGDMLQIDDSVIDATELIRDTAIVPTGSLDDAVDAEYVVALEKLESGVWRCVCEGRVLMKVTNAQAAGTLLGAPNNSTTAAVAATTEKIVAINLETGNNPATPVLTLCDFYGIGAGRGLKN
jgi:hypothetical protein